MRKQLRNVSHNERKRNQVIKLLIYHLKRRAKALPQGEDGPRRAELAKAFLDLHAEIINEALLSIPPDQRAEVSGLLFEAIVAKVSGDDWKKIRSWRRWGYVTAYYARGDLGLVPPPASYTVAQLHVAASLLLGCEDARNQELDEPLDAAALRACLSSLSPELQRVLQAELNPAFEQQHERAAEVGLAPTTYQRRFEDLKKRIRGLWKRPR